MGISIFEIIGPIMIGPSSSHTAGMARIGMMAHFIVGEALSAIHLDLSPMLRSTYCGHRTDAALIGGAMGIAENNPAIKNAIQAAHEQSIATSVDFLTEGEFPQNTALLSMQCKSGRRISVLGTSIGGGSIAITSVDGVSLQVAPDAFHIFIWSKTPLPTKLFPKESLVQGGNTNENHITCLTFSHEPKDSYIKTLRQHVDIEKMSLVRPVLEYGVSLPSERKYKSCSEICAEAKEKNISLAEVAIQYEMARSGFSYEAIRARMLSHLKQIKISVEQGYEENQLLYGLASGKDAKKLRQAIADGNTISGGIVPMAVARALGVMEYNASMGCIVAAPTAGSSGIIPGCMVTIQEEYHFSDEQMTDALLVSSLMGIIMANRDVSFSGSVGGCQGEVGVSSAISAAGMASLFTKDPKIIIHAMALCLKNLLGLVCDPIAGPVEIPCIKRNAVGVANAFTSVDMAIAGIQSFIPPDEVIDALADVEKRLPQELKCATIGGLACTKTAQRVRKSLSMG